ncbi:MAG: FtsX-like permease family protein [Rhodobacteraceae bacterium]|nr:FtsX-like permease family protein [Paracoccaceae bacterium]
MAADRVVPPAGFTARLTALAAAAMAFLAVFALALALAAGRLADRWQDALAGTATVRVAAPPEAMAGTVRAVLAILAQTPGVAAARPLDSAEQRALLAPWFGPDLSLERLPLPTLIDVVAAPAGFDAEGLAMRLAAEAPGAILDDHGRWRRPLVAAAGRLRLLALAALALIGGTTAAMVALAAEAALAANRQVIGVLRLVGARDAYIARAFVRRFTRRTLFGAAAGTLAGMAAVAAMPAAGAAAGLLDGLAPAGLDWVLPLAIPGLAAIVAFAATRAAAFRLLRELP